ERSTESSVHVVVRPGVGKEFIRVSINYILNSESAHNLSFLTFAILVKHSQQQVGRQKTVKLLP
ncbi:hypothetical protein L9F63_022754, partial [Diploptera punctata]